MRSDNRNMRRMMGRMGVSMGVLDDAQEVIIRTASMEIVIEKPQINKMDTKEGTIFMVVADNYVEQELETSAYSEDDIELLCIQANVDRETAIATLSDCDGELATALVRLKS